MARTLTKKQRGFVKDYLETGNGTQAVLKHYDTDSPDTAAVIATENLSKPKVIAYLESKAEKAAEFVYQLAETGENENVRLGASKDILDRAGFKPVEKSVGLTATIDILNDNLKELADALLHGQRDK